jgi:hypothetical protein
MPYDPVEDIPNIGNLSIDALDSDESVRRVNISTRHALNPSNFKLPCSHKKEVTGLLKHQLIMFSITHASIRELVAAAFKHEYYPLVGDALSLTREQIEKIFIVAALLNNPDKAFKQFLRTSWKTEYEGFLLHREEEAENKRFDNFLKNVAPKQLDKLRRTPISRWKAETIVSDFAKRAVTYKWNNPGDDKPDWFINHEKKKKKGKNRYSRLQDYVRDYFEFATPGKSARFIKDPELKRFLYRWHKEYSFYSQYTHVTVGKMIFSDIHQKKDFKSQEAINLYGEKFATRAIHASYTATATACAIVLTAVSNSHGANRELRDLWKELAGFSLFSKALWNMYIKDIV